MNPTLGQIRKLIEQTDNTPGFDKEAMRFLLESGLYTDLLRFSASYPLRMRMEEKKVRSQIKAILGIFDEETGGNLFSTPAVQLEIFNDINKRYNLGFGSLHFVALGPTPIEDATGLVVWTLEATLKDPAKTFEFIRSLIVCPRSSDGIMHFSGTISGINPMCEWKPMSLRWVKIDLGAAQGVIPKDGLCRQSAHCGPLWQAVYSPNWLANIGKTVGGRCIPEVSLPGFLLEYKTEEGLGGVPHIEPNRLRQHNMCRSYTYNGIGFAALARYV